MAAAITRRTFAQIGVIGVAVLGCATADHEGGRGRAPTLRTPSIPASLDPSLGWLPRSTSDHLTAAELSAARGSTIGTAYDLLVRLRPAFLSPRDARTATMAGRGLLPAVHVDGMYSGGVEALRTIAASVVMEMQYVRAIDAMHRYGPSYQAGVILVRLKR